MVVFDRRRRRRQHALLYHCRSHTSRAGTGHRSVHINRGELTRPSTYGVASTGSPSDDAVGRPRAGLPPTDVCWPVLGLVVLALAVVLVSTVTASAATATAAAGIHADAEA